MEKLFFILGLIFIGFTYSNATCPSGWTSTSVTYDYYIQNQGNCTITVYYCTFTAPTGEFKILVDKVLLEIPCGIGLLVDEDFWDDMNNQVRDHAILNTTFPPCPHSVLYVELKRAECWSITNVPEDPLNPVSAHVELNYCGLNGYCECKYSICYDMDLEKVVINPTGCTAVSSELCSNTIPELPPDGYD